MKVDLCARKQADAQASVGIIQREGGTARAYQCDIANPDSVRDFSVQLLEDSTPVDILVLSAAQWLEGALGEEDTDTDIVSTINSGLTGSILLTKTLLPSLRRSQSADILAMISVCGVPQFHDSIAHPAFFAAKHGLSGFSQNLAHHVAQENIRVTGFYPPDFEVTGFDDYPASGEKMGEHLLNARSIWETMRFVLTQPRSCHINAIHFQGPTHTDIGPY